MQRSLRPLTYDGHPPRDDGKNCVTMGRNGNAGQVFLDSRGHAVIRFVRSAPMRTSFDKDGEKLSIVTYGDLYMGPSRNGKPGNIFAHPIESDPTRQTVHREAHIPGVEFGQDGYLADDCKLATGEDVLRQLQRSAENTAAEERRAYEARSDVQQERMNNRMADAVTGLATVLGNTLGDKLGDTLAGALATKLGSQPQPPASEPAVSQPPADAAKGPDGKPKNNNRGGSGNG